MIFPGNQLLLKIPGIKVRATPAARKHIEDAVCCDAYWLNHGPEFVERTMRDKYHSDPLVMRLLDLYLESAPVDNTSKDSDRMEPWPTI